MNTSEQDAGSKETRPIQVGSEVWRRRLVLGVALGLVVAAALVGSLFIFGRERGDPLPVPATATPTLVVPSATSPVLPPTVVVVLPPTHVATALVVPTRVATKVIVPPTLGPTVTGPVTQVAVTTPTAGATATPAASATPSPVRAIKYTVQPGDTLSGIAERFNTTTQAIYVASDLVTDVLQPGQVLTVPVNRRPSPTPAPATSTEEIPQPVPSSVSTVAR